MGLLITFILLVSSPGILGYIQQLTIYEQSGRNQTFTENVPDASILNLKTVVKVCGKGNWVVYKSKNYGMMMAGANDCVSVSNHGEPDMDVQSFRYGGAKDTSMDALSIYENDFYTGREIRVEGNMTMMAQITGTFKSIMSTGWKKWTIFQGTEFDGPHFCFNGAINDNTPFNEWFDVTYKSISKIGSVVQGCLSSVEEGVRNELMANWTQIKSD